MTNFSFFKREMKPPSEEKKEASKWKKWRRVLKIQFLVFLILFVLLEISLRIVGFKPGVLEDWYYQSGEVEWDPVLYGDEMGITHHSQEGNFITDQVLNTEGFMSEVEYTAHAMDSLRALGKKIILLVGDSYTQGCCAESYRNSFAALLNTSEEYEVLNFGVGGTDPLHYELVVKKYLPLLKPDLVSINVYLGNDQMDYDRTPKPFVPVCYPVKNGPWLSSEAFINLRPENTYFKNFEGAKKFFYSYYSLNSEDATWYEKIIRQSIIFSRIYLYVGLRSAEIEFREKQPNRNATSAVSKPPFTYQHLKEIQQFCTELATPVLFTAIPSPENINNGEDIKRKYHHLFEDLTWESVSGIVPEDYDGKKRSNHFIDSGHRKYATFLKQRIEEVLKK